MLKGDSLSSKTHDVAHTPESKVTEVSLVILAAAAAAVVASMKQEIPKPRRRLMDTGALEPTPPRKCLMLTWLESQDLSLLK